MADEARPYRGINWREMFPLTHVFRAFRIAIHPSKLLLALAALLMLYVGGRILDGIWPVRHLAVPGEIHLYQSAPRAADFHEMRKGVREGIEQAYANRLMRLESAEKISRTDAEIAARSGDRLDDLKKEIIARRDAAADEARAAFDKEPGDAAAAARDERIRHVYASAYQELVRYKTIRGAGLFSTFFDYEVRQVYGVIGGVIGFNWINDDGVFPSIYRFFAVGPAWAMRHHPVYFTIYSLFFLFVWAIFGGAVSRIAAVHVAREEKISVRQALSFAVGKFLSFLSAPLIPLLIVAFIGLAVTAGALVGNIPYIGPIIIGLFYFLALIAGFVMTLVLLGTAGGFNLMYPTIAIEGSDSFDAISRSFSYLYARPWRLALYTIVAVIYGALTFLFVRLFLFVMLTLAHQFTDMGMFINAPDTGELWTTLWPTPTFSALTYDIDYLTLGFFGDVAAGLIAFWTFTTVALLGAYAISYYLSVNTIIYYLMRSEVDATEMDDVYLEQTDEEFSESAPPTADETAAPPASTTPGTPQAPSSSAASDNAPVENVPMTDTPAAQPEGESSQPPATPSGDASAASDDNPPADRPTT